MSATLLVEGLPPATVKDGHWTCSDRGFARALNAGERLLWQTTAMASPWNPDRWSAEHAAEEWNGRVTDVSKPPPAVAGRIY